MRRWPSRGYDEVSRRVAPRLVDVHPPQRWWPQATRYDDMDAVSRPATQAPLGQGGPGAESGRTAGIEYGRPGLRQQVERSPVQGNDNRPDERPPNGPDLTRDRTMVHAQGRQLCTRRDPGLALGELRQTRNLVKGGSSGVHASG